MKQYVFDAFTDHVFAGTLYCRKVGERIKMSGKAVTYSVAEINF